MPNNKARLLLAVAMAGLVVLAGCGRGVEYNDAVGRLHPPGTNQPLIASVPPDIGSGTGSAAATPTPLAPETPGTTTPATSPFCHDVTDVQGLIGTLLRPTGNAAAAKQAQSLAQKLKADAPPELQGAVTTLLKIQDRLLADLSTSPPNLTDLGAAITSPSYQQALQQIVLYAAQHCSINLTPPSP